MSPHPVAKHHEARRRRVLTSATIGALMLASALLIVLTAASRTVAASTRASQTAVAQGQNAKCLAAPGGGLTLANVASAGGVVRAVGSNGLIARSTASAAPTRWRVEPTPLIHNLRGITWSGTRWVAVGDVGSIVYLDQGRWAAVPGLPNSGLRGIAARPGLLAASGSGGVLLTSPDGINWTAANSGTTDLLWGGTNVDSTLLISGQESTVLASEDGASWRTLPTFPLPTGSTIAPRPLLWQLAVSGQQIVAVGDFGAILEGALASGLRGVRSPTNEILRGITYGRGRWVAVGSGGTLLRSLDGRRWSVERSPSEVDLRGVTWTGRSFVAVGDEGTVISSPNGSAWRLDTSAMPCALLGLAAGPRSLVAVGGSGRILLSSDGRRWRVIRSPTSNDLYAVARGRSGFVAVGAMATILTSSAGKRWVERQSPTRLNLHAVTWTGSEYLAGGDRGVLLSSGEGVRWQRVSAYPGFHSIRSFAGDGSSEVAAGAGTIALRSAPKAPWLLLPVGLGKFQTSVAYGNGRFVVVGHNGEALVSSDGGASWSAVVSGVTQNLDTVIWTGSGFVAAGEGVAIASPDGSTWHQVQIAGPHSVRALASWRGGLVGVGDLTSKVSIATP